MYLKFECKMKCGEVEIQFVKAIGFRIQQISFLSCIHYYLRPLAICIVTKKDKKEARKKRKETNRK